MAKAKRKMPRATAAMDFDTKSAKDHKPKKWIQGMGMKKGALHKMMGVPEGEKIPRSKLQAAAKKSGKLGKRARLALTLGKMKKGK